MIGTLVALPYAGMPGAWTCASISIVLMYIDDQDREILQDRLTGLNNRKTLDAAFSDYARQSVPGRELFLFMLDLDDFKKINDTLGHPVGDQALVSAAGVLTRSVSGLRAIVTRFGGDEFIIMGFFPGEAEAQAFKGLLSEGFSAFNRDNCLPYRLNDSIGFARHRSGESLDAFIKRADAELYSDKARRKAGR